MQEKTIDYILRATWQAVARMYNEEATKYGATMALGFTSLSIDIEGTPSTALAPKMGMEPTSLTRPLKSMEDKRLITKTRSKKDGRSVIIKLTKLGQKKRELSKQTVLRFNEVIKEHIPEEKLNHFMEVADIINELINEKSIFTPKG